ncbi:isochorismatase family protein [Mesorhizobium sp. NPDC059054]|uniref:isochorismatase family protein n=1 Tax=Mesorhizobium sp. NPDC059054 TaxID=3346711 RepID=UPI003680F372
MTAKAELHRWRIEEREYARQEERRGKRHAFQNLVSSRTALIVIDMVPFFVAQSSYCRGIIPNINQLADALRAEGGCVAWVLPSAEPANALLLDEFFGAEVSRLYRLSGGSGSVRDRLWPELKVGDDDLLIEKHHYSAFFPGSSTLLQQLQARNIDTVLITGTVTNICCESSARDAHALGLRVIMVADANAARRDEDHNATLHNIYRSFGDVRTCQEVLALIAEAATAASSPRPLR